MPDQRIPAGLGFAVNRRQLVTCAHVVNAALRRPAESTARPDADATVEAIFPLVGIDTPVRLRVTSWWPPDGSAADSDLAEITLVEGELPPAVSSARLTVTEPGPGTEINLFGYPGNPPRIGHGAWSNSTLRGRVGRGLLQIDMNPGTAMRTQPGYSGSPLLAKDPEAVETVVGMLSMSGKANQNLDSYAVSVSSLARVLPSVLPEVLRQTFQAHFAKRRKNNLVDLVRKNAASLPHPFRLPPGEEPAVLLNRGLIIRWWNTTPHWKSGDGLMYTSKGVRLASHPELLLTYEKLSRSFVYRSGGQMSSMYDRVPVTVDLMLPHNQQIRLPEDSLAEETLGITTAVCREMWRT
ncbi:S1 family peptidase [Streptomyces liangshanensis]|uniref:S1 family peptidase n=1 Tax=Streptomyces liangshanensis TaxID=2717324 RepID=UPI0036DEDE06